MFPNISKSKGNQTMKYGQSIEYNLIISFFEKSYTKCGEETSSRSFPDKLSISLDQKSKVLCSLFLFYAKFRAVKIYSN